jgi:hypothetical protein
MEKAFAICGLRTPEALDRVLPLQPARRSTMRAKSVLAGIAILTMIGCGGSSPTEPGGGGSTGSGSGSSSGSGSTLNVRITDNPFGSARAVLVTFNEVAARDAGGNWRTVAISGGATRTCDLKKLQNSNQDLLASGSISPGSYTHIRLTVQSAKIFFDNGSTSSTPCATTIAEPAGAVFPLRLAPATGEVNGTYTVPNGGTLNVLIDFDAEASIKDQGGQVYDLTPTLRLLSVS